MTPNKSPAALLPARWYVVTNYGAATLCLDEADARKVAHECDLAWPKNAPHVAVQLAPVANESRGSVPDDLAGRVHDEIMRLDGGVRRWEDMGESQRAAWRNGLSILTPTPPAVASGEPTAEQLKVLDEVIRLLESPHVMPTPTGGVNYAPERYFGLLHDFKRMRSELATAGG